MAVETQRYELGSYKKTLDRLWQSAALNYPKHVSLETLTLCPAACTFCPYPSLERKGTRMSDELIAKVIRDLKDIPPTFTFAFSPFKVNDPFVDKRLFDILRTVNRELPNAYPTLNTSAVPLTPKMIAELATIERMGYLWLSINDHRPAEYTKLMQLPWDKTIRAVDMVHAAVVAGALRCKVVLSRVADGTEADQGFLDWVAQSYPAFKGWLFTRGDWIGQVKEQVGQVPDIGCRHWFDLSITSTGVVSLCCMDGTAAWPIGDVNKEHTLDIYNKPEYKRLRLRTISRLEVAPCNGCTLL